MEYSNYSAIDNKMILRFKNKESEGRFMAGDIKLIIYEDEGDYILEYADILSAGENTDTKGNIACCSHLVNFDETVNGNIMRNEHYLDIVDGDFIRWCTTDYLVATADDKEIYPCKGWVFCALPLEKEKPKTEKIILLNQQPDTNKEGYYTEILYIHEHDSKTLKTNVGDKVYCVPNSDIPIVIMGKKYLRIPANKVLGKAIK